MERNASHLLKSDTRRKYDCYEFKKFERENAKNLFKTKPYSKGEIKLKGNTNEK